MNGAKPKFDKLVPRLEKGIDFELTEEAYKKHTGAYLPRNKSYIEKNSALAKICKKYGYRVKVIQSKTVKLVKS